MCIRDRSKIMEGSFKETRENHSLFFLMSGISSLAAWNGVLTALDFFQGKFAQQNVFFLYPIPVNMANILVNILLFLYSSKLSLNLRIIGGLILSGLILALLPFCVYIEDKDLGFVVSLGVLFLLGLFSSLYQISMTGFATKFEIRYITIFFVGTGFSGLMMSVLRILCLAIFGTSQESLLYSTILYFIAAGLMNGVTLILYSRFKKSEAYFSFIAPSESALTASTQGTIQTERESLLEAEKAKEKSSTVELAATLSVTKQIFIYLSFMILLYVQTFMLFPGVSLARKVSFLDGNWSPVIMITIYNIFDTVGKNFSEKRDWYSPTRVFVVILSRFVFYWLFISVARATAGEVFDSDYILIGTMILFAMTNGFGTSALMVLAPERATQELREKVGFVMVFGLLLGICSGSFLALPLAKVIHQ
eukprot:TRINITY_DN3645_c0_g2_i2.p1 TRINITY_DN3645_c0_g2~~TRINITY_DN3645_c0_g2_i2.p1  ORF type:complete len:469 (-),score=111.97 TRINITY_DN3645_c0_g2_i2:167-1429(-)